MLPEASRTKAMSRQHGDGHIAVISLNSGVEPLAPITVFDASNARIINKLAKSILKALFKVTEPAVKANNFLAVLWL